MQDNTESEKPEEFPENGEPIPEAEETAPSESPDSAETGPEFEEQEGEVLPPEEKRKSSAGKVFLFLILILAGSGSYLYFNNLIPPEILNLVFPKSAPSMPPALITQTPPFIEDVAEVPEPVEVIQSPIAEPFAVSPERPETPETLISDDVAEPKPMPLISGNDFDQTDMEEKESFPETVTPEETQPEETVVEEPREVPEKAEPVVTEEVVEEVEFIREAVAETVTPPTPASPEPEGPQRSKASQAYLDFIESSVLKIGELIEEGFHWGWDYLKKELA